MNFVGPRTRLSDIDLPRIGAGIGVGEDELHAFLDVETLGGGFDALGRPKMLFEPHIFYRNLNGTKLAQALQAGLAYPKWGAKPYPKDSYPRLLDAMQISETAALKSASWGIGQILGENYVAAGYLSVQAMVDAFVERGEPEQLEAAVRFIKANRLDDELRAHNWAGFARGYNGPQYARNAYDAKLASAFARWMRIRDTTWSPVLADTLREAVSTPGVVPDPSPPLVIASRPATRPAPPPPRQAAPVTPPPPAPSFWSRLGRLIAGA